MEVDSSTASAHVPPSVDKKLKEVKQELNSLQAQVTTIDYEGGRHLDHVSKDLVFFFKENSKEGQAYRELSLQATRRARAQGGQARP